MTIADKLITIADNTPLVAAAVNAKKGKNLFDPDRTEGRFSTGGGNTNVRPGIDFNKFYLGLTRNNYYYPSHVTSYSYDGDTLSFVLKNEWYGIGFPVKVTPNTKYIARADRNCSMGCGFFTADGTFLSQINNLAIGATTPVNCEVMMVCFYGENTGETYTVRNIQVEVGETATAYEDYKDPQLYEEALAKANEIKTALTELKEALL